MSVISLFALAIVTAARKLRPYFQSHPIVVLTSLPLRTILHSPTQSGRLAKWAIELSEFDLEFRARTSLKSQVLADFLIELPLASTEPTDQIQPWVLQVDGASSKHGSGVGTRLTSPTGEVLEQSFRLAFNASNNKVEYESLLAGLRLAVGVGVQNLHAHCDSQLVANQYSGDYEAKDARMEAYLNLVQELAGKFEKFELTRIPRAENSAADALAALASTSEVTVARIIPVEIISQPSIRLDGISFVTTRAMRRRLDAQSAENGPPQLGDDEEISDEVHSTESVENQSLPGNHNVPSPVQPPHDWGQTGEN
ncbi:Ribonuclease H domain [Arabidopsis suecica]|uniref:Ribonuclease H domain n=1 Tax=Arabidopsis suecica TaxID=45249 RepID=A0A8T2HHQ6_ARASU|nr:Ribonuclease H domain [Arabidopsis suecica]